MKKKLSVILKNLLLNINHKVCFLYLLDSFFCFVFTVLSKKKKRKKTESFLSFPQILMKF